MYEHEWVPSESSGEPRRYCKHCGIYEDYADKFPVCSGPGGNGQASQKSNDHQEDVFHERYKSISSRALNSGDKESLNDVLLKGFYTLVDEIDVLRKRIEILEAGNRTISTD